jgi:thiol-disulfide isomerase/thioredoxin
MMPKPFVPILLLPTSSTVWAQSSVKPLKTPGPPQISNDARFRSLDSTAPISMADYHGKVVVLTLWASWCGPCRAAVNGLVELDDEFARRGVQVIALSMEDPEKSYADMRRFVEGFPSGYKVGWISAISANRLMTRNDILPQIFVMRNGVVIKTLLGWHPTMTVTQLRQVLDEAAGKATVK